MIAIVFVAWFLAMADRPACEAPVVLLDADKCGPAVSGRR